jgi:hypothetical protein
MDEASDSLFGGTITSRLREDTAANKGEGTKEAGGQSMKVVNWRIKLQLAHEQRDERMRRRRRDAPNFSFFPQWGEGKDR